jgi:alpha-tubulin suppressor-like RCC1 family protein
MKGFAGVSRKIAMLGTVCAALAGAGCKSSVDTTRLDVVVNVDPALKLDSVEIDVEADGVAADARPKLIQPFTVPASSGTPPMIAPIVWEIPISNVSGAPLIATVTAKGIGSMAVTQEQFAKVEPGQRTTVILTLTSACVGKTCTSDETCSDGTCGQIQTVGPGVDAGAGGGGGARTNTGGSAGGTAAGGHAGAGVGGAGGAGGAGVGGAAGAGPINGGPCSAGSDCASTFCAQGVCCNSACTDSCYACTNALTGSSPNGTCAVVSSGVADPAGVCVAGASTSCGNTGYCDGKGACEKFGGSAICKPASCGASGYTSVSTCDGKGTCVGGATTSCGQFTCSATTGCASTCAADTDCPGGYCSAAKTCAATLSDGSTCSANDQCTHANCISGVCCATACAGTCMTCATGACKPVAAGGSSNGACAVGTTTCGHDGFCDGNGGCRNAISTVACGSASCGGGQLTPTGLCNGAGSCSTPAAAACSGGVVCASTTACKVSTCAADADCVSGLCQSGACATKRSNGQACTATDQCKSGFCADGVCCTSACNGTCQACTNALTGSSPDGTCSAVSSGLADPAGGCTAGTPASCGNTGHCDGKGACEKFGSSTVCQGASCGSAGFTAASTCDGKGTCTQGTTTGCKGFTCSATTGCATSCSADTDCPGGYCTSAMTCAATMSDGSSCSKSSQCAHANCVSGICCATACAGTCMTCATGLCKPVMAGGSSASACPIDPTPCGHDGTCDGNGGCRYATSSVSCGSTSCSGGQLAPIGSCNGAGACATPAAAGCPGGVVCASTTACRSSTCAADTDCVSGLCLSGACTAKRAIAQTCTGNDQCTSGFCADGVCCNSACNGTCQGCDESTGTHTPGTCATISGAPRSGHGTCMGTGVCVSACNGSSASCVFPTSSMSCRSASCSGGSQTLAAGCDGAGNCPTVVTKPCGQFICGATSCLNNCSGNSQCLSGDACVSGVCTACTSGQSVCPNACANLSSDGANCGACGHSCLGGTCSGGRCQAVAVSAGVYNTCALLANGAVACWGDNTYGQLGNSSGANSGKPGLVPGVSNAVAIAAGATTCAVLSTGALECWGYNAYGQLANGKTSNSSVPVTIGSLKVASVAVGGDFVCAALQDGTVDCWGSNVTGDLGNNSTTNSPTPVKVSGVTGAVAVTAGDGHACALLSGGGISCWGYDGDGELGNGSTPLDSPVPVAVSGLFAAATTVQAGSAHTCALEPTVEGMGRQPIPLVQCWGTDSFGQLGDGTTNNSALPVGTQPAIYDTSGQTSGIGLALGYDHSCAMVAGEVECWGYNEDGELGNGTAVNAPLAGPQAVPGVTTAVGIAAGYDHTCALLANGTMACWGLNDHGQLGNGTTTSALSPTAVIW